MKPTKPSELLDSPEKWTKGCSAKDDTGCPVASTDDCATCWCLVGAVSKCNSNSFRPKIEAAIKIHFRDRIAGIVRIMETQELVLSAAFNDHPETTFEDVRAVLLEAGL